VFVLPVRLFVPHPSFPLISPPFPLPSFKRSGIPLNPCQRGIAKPVLLFRMQIQSHARRRSKRFRARLWPSSQCPTHVLHPPDHHEHQGSQVGTRSKTVRWPFDTATAASAIQNQHLATPEKRRRGRGHVSLCNWTRRGPVGNAPTNTQLQKNFAIARSDKGDKGPEWRGNEQTLLTTTSAILLIAKTFGGMSSDESCQHNFRKTLAKSDRRASQRPLWLEQVSHGEQQK
jgi:hypothetical protein